MYKFNDWLGGGGTYKRYFKSNWENMRINSTLDNVENMGNFLGEIAVSWLCRSMLLFSAGVYGVFGGEVSWCLDLLSFFNVYFFYFKGESVNWGGAERSSHPDTPVFTSKWKKSRWWVYTCSSYYFLKFFTYLKMFTTDWKHSNPWEHKKN